jgi:ATP-dependent Lhr-like helicase
VWQRLAAGAPPDPSTATARAVLSLLQEAGASFFDDIIAGTRLLRTQVETALGELVAAGLVTCDGFAGLRALIGPSSTNGRSGGPRRLGDRRPGGTYRRQQSSLETAGRWSLARATVPATAGDAEEQSREIAARALLKRYGVVFRRLTDREPHLPPWREMVRTLRRLETRGEIRGGHFVSGVGGEQFALPEAVGALREVRRTESGDEVIVLSAVDPVNALGVTTPPGTRLAARTGNRVAYRAGRPIAVLDGGRVTYCEQLSPEDGWTVQKGLLRGAIAEPAGLDTDRASVPALTGAR